MLDWFETRIAPFKEHDKRQPPTRLLPFMWHYIRQVWPGIALISLFGLIGGIFEVALFEYVGRIVDLAQKSGPRTLIIDNGPELLAMLMVVLLVRPIIAALHLLLVNQVTAPNLMHLIRWQHHRYVLRQSVSFFQNDFAGRIANKVMQTGPSIREAVISLVDAVWFVSIYWIGALYLFAVSHWSLVVPLIIWLFAYITTLSYFVPRIKREAAITSDQRSILTGRIVDSYNNIQMVKLFAHTDHEERYALSAMEDLRKAVASLLRKVTMMNVTLWTINGLLIASAISLAVWLWSDSIVSLGTVSVVAGLAIRITNMSNWIMWVVSGVFENIGTSEDGMKTIARPYQVTDHPSAKDLDFRTGEITFENVTFHYDRVQGEEGKQTGGGTSGGEKAGQGARISVLEGLNLTIKPGERIGLIGRSGAGKSTLVNLLLRFHDLEAGRIAIDGQNIAEVRQDSLRAHIGMVSQETALLHRSIRDNVRYGSDHADDQAVLAALEKAEATGFLDDLVDQKGRVGLEAHAGERGVKLSGGQRQRIAIARVLLKNAPILILDEATSALDSEVEAAIQSQLYNLMDGKTVIAIAHRLSTIASLDRLIVLDKGRIVEEGTHSELIRNGGLYAQLWARQSGGFLAVDDRETEEA